MTDTNNGNARGKSLISDAHSADSVELTITLPKWSQLIVTGESPVTVDWSRVPAHMWSQLVPEGLFRVLKDGMGGKDKSNAERVAGAQKRLDAIMSGDWEARGGTAMSTYLDKAFRNRLEAASGAVADAAYKEFKVATIKEAGFKFPVDKDGKARLTTDQFLKAYMAAKEKDDDWFAGLVADAAALKAADEAAVAKIDIKAVNI